MTTLIFVTWRRWPIQVDKPMSEIVTIINDALPAPYLVKITDMDGVSEVFSPLHVVRLKEMT